MKENKTPNVAYLEASLKAKDAKYYELLRKYNQKTKQNTNLLNQAKAMQSERDGLQNKVTHLEIEIICLTRHKEENKKLVDENQRLARERQQLQVKLEEEKKSKGNKGLVESLSSEIMRLKEENRELEKKLRELEKEKREGAF